MAKKIKKIKNILTLNKNNKITIKQNDYRRLK